MKEYTREELLDMINKARTSKEIDSISELVAKLNLPSELKDEVEMEIFCQWDMINNPWYHNEEDYPSAYNGSYSPSAPWNAPGMSIHDFI